MENTLKLKRDQLLVSRIPGALKGRIRQIARRENTSVTRYLEALILSDLKRRGEEIKLSVNVTEV
jgi:hypothetical protein